MKTIPLSEIQVKDNRQRREFDPDRISELADDIANNSLLHPIVLRKEADQFILVAGERRLRAITMMHELGIQFKCDGKPVEPDKVPFVYLGELSELEAEEAELSENIRRVDLSWQEQAEAHSRLQLLRSRQAQSEGRVQTLQATAAEIAGKPDNRTASTLSTELAVAKHLDDPEVRKAKSLSDAAKVVRKKLTREHNERIAATLGARYQASEHQLFHSSSTEPELQSSIPSFDCLITDPPYGVNADSFGSQGSKEREYQDSSEGWSYLMDQTAAWTWAKAKPEAHGYIFCDFSRFNELAATFALNGWEVWPRPIIWSKGNGVAPKPEHGPRYTYECILFISKGNKPVRILAPDVISCSSPATTGHPDQKPEQLYIELLQRSCIAGDTIVDPFAGSGTVFLAAHQLRLKAIGIELSAHYYAIASKRLEQLTHLATL